jgi:FSR family fosmidomycin resistance protein-like MFS transporter
MQTESTRPGWGLTLAGLSHFTLELCHNFLPVLYPLLVVSMGLTYGQIGVIALIVGLVTSLPQPFLGFLSDRFGAYRVSALSILWLGLLMSLVGFAQNYLLFALLVGLASLGSAAYHPAGAVLASAHSRVRRGVGMSIFSVGGNLGSAVSPLLIAALLPWFDRNAALIMLPIAFIVSGLLYAQAQPTSLVRRAQTAVTAQSGTLLRTALILLTAAAMTRAWFQVSLLTYLPVWIESAGGTVAQASRLLAVFAFAIGGGAMFGGTVSDRVGPWRVVVISFLLIAPAYWLFLHSSGPLQYLVLALIGFAIGNTYPTFVIMAQDCWTQRAAVASGLIMGIGWAPGGLGASFTGYLADLSTLDYSLQFLVVPPLLGLACMVGWRWVVRHHSV